MANFIVYAGKRFVLVKHTILDGKKKVLEKNGTTEKAPLSDKFSWVKECFKSQKAIMRLGRWLWIKEPGKYMGRLISI